METAKASGRGSSLHRALLSGALLLTIALTGTTAAIAAPCAWEDCDNVARHLQSPEVSLNGLTIRIVDLANADGVDDPVAAGLTESMAPLLFLTPRVTSILEDVFEDSDTIAMVESVAHDPEFLDGNDERPASPVAENSGASNEYESAVRAEHADLLPKYQRQMYRTDI